MAKQKRKFYVIGHNPNTLAEAEAFLKAGANALEPDICYAEDRPDQYFVSHGPDAGANDWIHKNSLVVYLTGLKKIIQDPEKKYNLALIAFDIKYPKFNINEFIDIVFKNFSDFPICSGVAILITVGSKDDQDFLNKYDQTRANVGIGVDEEKEPKKVEDSFTTAKQTNFCYANGIIAPGIKWGVFKSIMKAKGLQGQAQGNSFKLIHTWVLASKASIRSYLDLRIDGIIVNIGTVPELLAILKEKHFLPMYELAKNGYNPYTAPPLPQYWLTIKTRDKNMAGTDVPVTFRLKGSAGTTESVLDADFKDVLEQNETDFITLEGTNIGTIQSLTISEQGSDISSDWLPQRIQVESNLFAGVTTFNFGPNAWLHFGHSMTKTPS
jgi:hypothetical protein